MYEYISFFVKNRNLVEARILRGSIGPLVFDSSGDLTTAGYRIYNVQKGQLVPVGKWMADNDPVEFVKPNQVVWPGGAKMTPEGFEIASHFRVCCCQY